MTTREALHAYIDVPDDAEATALLVEARHIVSNREAARPISWTELARMPAEEREQLMKSMHFEIDDEVLRAWDEATIGDGSDDE